MNRFVPLLFLIAALGLGTWLFTRSSTEPEPAGAPPDLAASEPQEPVSREVEPPQIVAENVSAAKKEDRGKSGQQECLDEHTLWQAWTETADEAVLAQSSTRGPDFALLRGIDFAGLNDLATQGNSAAMATLGVQNILRANRQNPTDAAALMDDTPEFDGARLTSLFPQDARAYSPEDMLALQEANYWLYQAALNGRVLALHEYGAVIGAQLRGPVGMNWLSRDEFDALSPEEQALFSPQIIYAQVAERILAPDLVLADGSALPEELKLRRASIVDRLTDEFAQDLEYAELPTPEPWTTPESVADLREQACPGVLEALETDPDE
ncbi:MAG: hypothetical protein AAFX44_05255 [Pseudomonadota bacterium]